MHIKKWEGNILRSSNVINLNKNQFIKFSTISIWIDYIFNSNGDIEKKHLAVIGLKNTKLDTHVIHPVSQFIIDNWKNNEYNTQRKHANNVVQFLNYLVDNRKKLNISTLAELSTKHGTQHLNDLTLTGVKKSTVKDAERTLTHFYYWLVKIEVIPYMSEANFVKKESHFGTYFESPFKPLYPTKTSREIEHTLPINYIPILLEVAITVAKPIPLGLYVQIFG